MAKIYYEIKRIVHNIDKDSLILELSDDKKDYTINFGKKDSSLYNNLFLDEFYNNKEEKDLFTTFRNNLLRQISVLLKKYTKQISNINIKLKECESMEKHRLYGELITANLYRFQSLNLEDFIEVENYYDENKEISIPIDKTISLNENAARYYKRYNKLKNTLNIVSIQKKETELELQYIESILFSIEEAGFITDLNEIYDELEESNIIKKTVIRKGKTLKSKKETNKAFKVGEPAKTIIDGFTVFYGKNNKQNEYVCTKLGSKDDIWFHTQNIQGSHVVLKIEGKEVPVLVLEKCAKIAKENSKAKNSTKVPVDYCNIKYVKKIPGAKPGMVTYSNFKTIII